MLEHDEGLLQHVADDFRLENAMWVDDKEWESWTVVRGGEMARRMMHDGSIGRRMVGAKIARPTDCEFYARDETTTYTVERPSDVGDLVRPMVKCGRDNSLKTVEECHKCRIAAAKLARETSQLSDKVLGVWGVRAGRELAVH